MGTLRLREPKAELQCTLPPQGMDSSAARKAPWDMMVGVKLMGQTGSAHSTRWKQPLVQAGRNEEHVWGSTGMDWMGEGGRGRGLTFITGPRVPQGLWREGCAQTPMKWEGLGAALCPVAEGT